MNTTLPMYAAATDLDTWADRAGPVSPTVPPDTREIEAVHHCYRWQFAALPELVRGVPDHDTARAAVVTEFVAYLDDTLHRHHTCDSNRLWLLLADRADLDRSLAQRMARRRVWIESLRTLAATRIACFADTADPESREQLAATLGELAGLLTEQLDDEEKAVVPAVEHTLDAGEWTALRHRGNESAVTTSELVFLGYLLQGTHGRRERHRLLAAVPITQRAAWHLVGRRRFRRQYRHTFGFRPIR